MWEGIRCVKPGATLGDVDSAIGFVHTEQLLHEAATTESYSTWREEFLKQLNSWRFE